MIFPSPLTVDNVTRIGEYVYPVGVKGTKSLWIAFVYVSSSLSWILLG